MVEPVVKIIKIEGFHEMSCPVFCSLVQIHLDQTRARNQGEMTAETAFSLAKSIRVVN